MLMESGGEPLYAQINRELKTKRLHSAGNTLTKADAINSKQIYDHYDLDVGPSKITYHDASNYEANTFADNRTDSAKLQNATGDSSAFYKSLNNNNTNISTDQNQWV